MPVPLERCSSRKIAECLEVIRIKPRRIDRVGFRGPSPPASRAEFPIVAIGASAGGLDACRKLLDALPAVNGMAFIIVQHLDPSHDSMMVDLLAGHTSMPVLLATDGMAIERERVYVIPPGVYLSADDKGALRLSKPQARHGARLPFDFLLNSLAREYGARAVCVVLSGTGADGSLGLKAVKAKGGLVIAQDIGEADYDGMPRSAIATGAVDLVLRAAKIAEALVARERGQVFVPEPPKSPAQKSVEDLLPDIIALLRTKTVHDFTLYKHGTLERRVERRMALAAVKTAAEYLDLLRRDAERTRSTLQGFADQCHGLLSGRGRFSIFWPRASFPTLCATTRWIGRCRIWVAGCSSGEETYSLAMLFREQIDASKREIKLQIFASDVDPDAVASAREGLYPDSIEADVSPERLARFFSKEDRNYRVSAELRSNVVFTVHDVLADPPFARLDFVSCRNLLIYLLPEAQAKVISIIHFALREGGLLLVGDAETVGVADGRFAVVSKPQRIYRRVGGARPGRFRSVLERRRRLPAARASRPGARAFAPDRARRALSTDGAGGLRSGCGADQPQTRMSLLPGTRWIVISRSHRAAPSNDVIAMAREGVRDEAEIGRSARAARERASRHARRADERRSRRLVIQHRRHAGAARARRAVAGLLRRGAGAAGRPRAAASRRLTFLASSSSNGSSKRQRSNCRTPSATSRSRAKSRWRSTRRRCPSTRNISRRTRSCSPPRRSFNRSTRS